MTSEELADATENLVRRASERILGSGQEQYSDGESQKFETMPLDLLLTECLDEIVDTVNYCSMLYLRVESLRQRVRQAESQLP